jgi:glutathione S-transferase
MKGYASANSPYARKVRIAAIETGQPDLIDWTMMNREQRAARTPAINPLGKVPAVVMDDGSALYDSPVIVEWVDSLHSGQKLIPQSGPKRWKALTLAALGDGLGEAAIAVNLELLKPDPSQALIDRQGGKAKSALAALNADCVNFNDPPKIGEIAVACAIGYMELRGVLSGWRDDCPALVAWYGAINQRPAFAATAPAGAGEP